MGLQEMYLPDQWISHSAEISISTQLNLGRTRNGAASSATERLPNTWPWVQAPNFCLFAGETPQFPDPPGEDGAATGAAGARCSPVPRVTPSRAGEATPGGSHQCAKVIMERIVGNIGF